MLIEWIHSWTLHGWAIFCCTVASLGLVGAGWASVGICFGKGALGFLNGSGRQPQVIVVNGSGQYVQQPQKRVWGLGRTYMLFAAIFSGGPMLTLLILAADHAAWYAVDWVTNNWWVLLVVPIGFLLVAAFWWLIKRDRQQETRETAELHAMPAVVTSGAGEMNTPTLAPIWTAPTYEGNWAERP